MKKTISLTFFIGLSYFGFTQQKFSLEDTLLLQPVEVTATRAADKAPLTKTNFSKKDIEKVNFGQDLPFVLNLTPSVVINSDAGNGIGYTGIRIRGTDASRTNVTLNGIPYNDAESQGTFFVDLPDISSSINNIQIQRGVGTSTNGAGAFGASINVSTNEVISKSYGELNNSFGSFNTWKNTIKAGTGLLNKHFTVDGRFSSITSDGFIDRAATDLKSFYVSAAYLTKNSSLRFNVINGKEKTYQAWNGIPESYLTTNRTYNSAGTEKPGTPYDNETDNYTQTHYQLFFNNKINNTLNYSLTAFLTRGKGYYEQYKAEQSFADYGLPDVINGADTISTTDLVRQLWLDNYFYGTIFSLNKKTDKTTFTLGGGIYKYDGKHYGILPGADKGIPADYKYYNLTAFKTDANVFAKVLHEFKSNFSYFIDLQLRHVKYDVNGFRDNPSLLIDNVYTFFNPKVGLTYNKNNYQAYLSYSVGSKEPNRDDFEAGETQITQPEKLYDFETGFEKKGAKISYGITGYYMYYHNQLVLTGKINDVGAYTRTNTPQSYRLGLELQSKVILNKWLATEGNITFSKNKIKSFTEFIDDYDNGGQVTNDYKNTTISFSPSIISSRIITITPFKNTDINFITKYVSRQYLDNTSKKDRSLDPYFTEDIRLNYKWVTRPFKEINFGVQVNNLFNKKYEPNGYTFSYLYSGSLATENYYFPMAGTNFMLLMNVKL
jgi:iron complex outermembrane receptor protein